jgi:hypothetical protein
VAQTAVPKKLDKLELQMFDAFEKVGYIKIDSIDKQVLYVKPIVWTMLKTPESQTNFLKKSSKYYNGHRYSNWDGYGKNWTFKIKLSDSKKLVGEQFKDLTVKIIEE